MADHITEIAKLLQDTLSPDSSTISAATQSLQRLSSLPHFPFLLLSISFGGENQGLRLVAASYLKNFTRRNIDRDGPNSKVSKEFKDQLMRTLLQAEHAVLKVLVEVFRMIVVAEFVEKNSWPELVPELRSAIQNSNPISNVVICEWKTINALTVLQSLLRPFQYFLKPKVVKEAVPLQLELIATEILVLLLSVFPQVVEKTLSADGRVEQEHEKIILIVCKCMYFSIRSHMPSALVSLLPSFSNNLIRLLGSLRFDCGVAMEEEYSLRLKTGKRSLLIFSSLITRHRKYCDKLMPDILNCALKIVKNSGNIRELDFLPERIISLAFDVVSHILETGPGWRLVSPHFSFLLESAIFPVLVLNEKDISEWEEDAEEYLRKNLPSELEEISGLREDLFTARKSAMNLLGVISFSKGPPMATSSGSLASAKRKKGEKNKKSNQRSSMGELLVFPFLSKFPIPSDANAGNEKVLRDYVGVLMAYGGLQDFLVEQKPGYVSTLLRNRVLPLYNISMSVPYLVASANWVLGELASCLPEELSADIYSSLLKALAMPDFEDISCYPVRVSAVGAIAELIENDYHPPEWLPLLQVAINRINIENEETSTLFQLLSSIVETGEENVADHIPFMVSSIVEALSKHIYSTLEPWTQVIEKGFAALAVMTQSWENLMPDEIEDEKWVSGQASIANSLLLLLQRAWLTPVHPVDQEEESSPTPSCLDDSSTLLRSIIKSVTQSNAIQQLKLSELLLVWANMIAEWNAWAELEDLSVFDCIKEVVTLHNKYGLKNFIATEMPPPPAPPVPQGSIIEGICAFVSQAISQYTSATWRACSCIHMLLHVPKYSSGNEGVKEALVVAFSKAAFSHFRERQGKPSPVWKPLLLVISSCYLCFPDTVEGILGKEVEGGFTIWVSALNFACTNSSDNAQFTKSELKLTVMTLAKIIERLLLRTTSNGAILRDSFNSLMEASVKLKEVQEEDDEGNEEAEDNGDDEEEDDDDDDDDDDDEEDSDDEHEETEEEFLQRYAQAAAELETNGVLEEGDLEDQEHEIDLGPFELVDEQMVIFSTIERSRHVLSQMQALSPQTISRFLLAFPECNICFQQ